MRKVYLFLFAISAICGLIIAFENIMIPANGLMIFFKSMSGNLFFPLLFVFLLGGMAGFFLGLAFSCDGKNPSEGGSYDNFEV